jgi:hypothetical protein
MKKILLALTLSLFISFSFSQTDTLVWIDFETDPATFVQNSTPPPGYVNDTLWYNFDADGQNDGSGNGRPLEWFWDYDFEDTINSAYISSSWTNGSIPTENWFVMGSIYISDTNAVLSWKSAPYQTPRYLDGYYVLLSTTNNDITSFTDTLFLAAEYVSLNDPSAPNDFASYTFTPGFVHGADGQYTFDTGDSSRLLGLLRPFTVSLSAYAGKSVYIAFKHHSVDDNLLAIDDILVTGTNSVGIAENSAGVGISAFPIPAANQLNLEIRSAQSSSAKVAIFDIMGRATGLSSEIQFQEGKSVHAIDVSGLASGTYLVRITTAKGSSSLRISVQ